MVVSSPQCPDTTKAQIVDQSNKYDVDAEATHVADFGQYLTF